jgi:DNA-directed RNA polymerase specialized sigma24 family protein
MKRGRPPKPDLTDDPQPRPPAEPIDDQTTLQKLDAIKADELDVPDSGALETLPEPKRKALKQRARRDLSYIWAGEEIDE